MSDKPNTNGAVDISQIDEDLVAYLDGELDPAESRAVEERLARDPAARRNLQRLEQTWDALGSLPRPDLGEDFTRSTVELVAVEADREMTQQMAAMPSRKLRMWLSIGAGTLLAALLGFVIVHFAVGDPNLQLLKDLAVLERIELYREVGTIDFLRELEKSSLLSDANLANVPLPPVASAEPIVTPLPAGIEERRTLVAKMSPAEKDQLKRRGEWLAELDEGTQIELRTLDAALAQDEQAAALERLMERYHRFLGTLPPESQRKLRSLAAAERVPYIQEILQAAASRRELTPPEMQAIHNWMVNWAKQKYGPDNSKTKWYEGGGPGVFGGGRMRYGDRSGWNRTPFERLEPAEFAELEKVLSPKSRELLDKIADPAEKKAQLATWISFTFQRGATRQPKIKEEELRTFFLTKLSDEQRYKLEALPPERFTEELTRLYRGPMDPIGMPGKKGEFNKGDFKKDRPDRPERGDALKKIIQKKLE